MKHLVVLEIVQSACGTPLAELVMNTAVPETRAALVAADLMKISIGRLASSIRAIISDRPFAQVVRSVKATRPRAAEPARRRGS